MGQHASVPGDSVEGLLSVSSSLGVSKLPLGGDVRLSEMWAHHGIQGMPLSRDRATHLHLGMVRALDVTCIE